jgi:hypothetical protein
LVCALRAVERRNPAVSRRDVESGLDLGFMKRLLAALLAGTAIAALAGPAQASPLTITASLYNPPVTAGASTVIDLTGITPASDATITTSAYTISFSVTAGQGVVQGPLSGAYAVPVAGASGGQPLYLTGNYGSALTPNIASSGNYLSTGVGTITIAFTSEQTAFAMLWGSIDSFNAVTFLQGTTTVGTVAGDDAATALGNGFEANGSQGAGGSGYVIVNSTTAFNTITFSSTTPSFEFAGIVTSVDPIGIPEPISLALFGAGLAGLGAVRWRRTA